VFISILRFFSERALSDHLTFLLQCSAGRKVRAPAVSMGLGDSGVPDCFSVNVATAKCTFKSTTLLWELIYERVGIHLEMTPRHALSHVILLKLW
jgi:hypothetical protein